MKRNKNLDSKIIIKRYKNVLGIPASIPITEKMIFQHWNLEKQLANKLKTSSVENRWEVTKKCYATFYNELYWLINYAGTDGKKSIAEKESVIIELIGNKIQRIYEIGSGKGDLIRFIAGKGHLCKCSDIFPGRGLNKIPPQSNLSCGISDGIHLDLFEKRNYYDLVLSVNVIEHFHPDDLEAHFKGVNQILKKGGRYFIKTPHKFFGPHGIEKVFGINKLKGFHLKEYTYTELKNTAEIAGFEKTSAIFYRNIPFMPNSTRISESYFKYISIIEVGISKLKTDRTKKYFSQVSRFLLMPRQVFVVITK